MEPYGVGADCQAPGSQTGYAVIDLRGTKWAVDDTFGNGGYMPGGTTSFSDPQYFTVYGGGYCGWVSPSSSVGDETAVHTGGWQLQLKRAS